MYMHLHNFTYY